jgi:hypothetical protein
MARKRRRKHARPSKPAKVRKARRSRPRPRGRAKHRAPDAAIVVSKIGTPIAIEVRRDHDGKSYRHHFSVNTKLYRTRDGRHLVIGPVRVSPSGVIEG